MFSLTPIARDYIRFLCKENNKIAVKLEVKGGGCSGFVYNYEFVDSAEPDDFEIDLLTCKFFVDSMSLLYVAGTELDYERTIGSSGLKLKNPNQKAGCGCGKSFSI
jgi:iron-sulfur cluster assembly accessory protein